MRKKTRSVHKLLAGLLAVVLLIPAGISPVRATETMTATVTNVTTMNHEEETCGVFTLDNGKYYGLCAHVGLQNPSTGSTVSMTPASPALRALAYEASKQNLFYWSDKTVWNLHEAASEIYSGVHNGVLMNQARNFISRANAVSEGKALDGSDIPNSFGAWITSGGNGAQELLVWGQKPFGNLTLVKTSSNSNITSGNSCYSLSGATYGIYANYSNAQNDRNRLATLTTDANGNSNTVELDAGNYYWRELTAPKGYALNTNVGSITVTSGSTAVIRTSDAPQSDPVGILLKKQGDDSKPLAGAEFTFRYYDGQYKTVAAAEASGAATRTWVIKTNDNGFCRLDPRFLVRGDIFFFDESGQPTVPIGTLLVQETSAPYGYILENTVYVINITSTGSSTEIINSYNEPTSTNVAIRKPIKIVKYSADGNIAGIKFRVQGGPEDVDMTVATGEDGSISIPNMRCGDYTVTEESINIYEPQESKTVTVFPDADKPAVVTFTNVLKRGSLEVTKSSEDGLVEGVDFRLTGTALNGDEINLVATTNAAGVATFNDVLISNEDYTIEEVDTGIRYVVPVNQSAAVNWNEVTKINFQNVLKKFNVQLVKKDAEFDTAQAGLSLAGAIYGVYKDGELLDQYTTDDSGKITTNYYTCGAGYTIKEITPPAGYLLDESVYPLTAEAENFTVEKSTLTVTSKDQVIKGNVEIVKHSDNGSIAMEHPEKGAEFQIYLKSAGSYDNAKDSERDLLTTDKKGWAKTKDLPYGTYVMHQSKGLPSSNLVPDFEVEIEENGKTYYYLLNNVPIEAYLRVLKVDAFDGEPIKTGAQFQIRNPDGSLYTDPITGEDIFKSDNKGYIKTSNPLPYGKGYKLIEIQAPSGYYISRELIDGVSFDVTADSYILDRLNPSSKTYVAIVDFTVKNDSEPIITTVAAASDGGKEVVLGKKAKIKDTVQLSNVIYGKNYTVNGWLVDKETGNPVLDDAGNHITATAKVKPSYSNTDTVTLTYIFDTTLLGGHDIVSYVELVRTFKGKSEVVAAEKDLNNADQTVHVPAPVIGTTAQVDGEKLAAPVSSVALTDTVSYENLTPGSEYAFVGTLMDKKTGEAVLDQAGNPITAKTVYTPKKSSGTANVNFVFDASQLRGKELVVFEQVLYCESLVCIHEDINDAGQTIRVTNPEIGTTAAVDGEHIALATDKITLVDTVSYADLIPGKAYTVSGQLMIKETSQALLNADGNAVIASKTFVPEKSSGKVDISFVFDAGALSGQTLVAFESLLYAEESVAEHAVIEDEDQSVHLPNIGTALKTDDENKVSDPLPTVKLFDSVAYENLIPGKEYTIVGKLMVKETGDALLDKGGTPVTSTVTFVPNEPNGTAILPFTIDARKLGGKSVVAFETIQYNGKDIAIHADLSDADQTVSINDPFIDTVATVNGEHIAQVAENTVLTDKVYYSNVTPGKMYTIVGKLMNHETGDVLRDADDAPVTAKVQFTAEAASGSVEVVFSLNSASLAGKSVVAFEELMREDEVIASHRDMEDENQTVHFPVIGTTAKSEQGTHISKAQENISITDTVAYRNLIPGKEYTVSGILMDKSTDKPMLDDLGKEIKATATFTPDSTDGNIDVVYTFPGITLAGKTIVAFENLFCGEHLLVTHSDIEDADQTVYLPKIHTTAVSDAGSKLVESTGNMRIIDTVKYENLIPGEEYTLNGKLMDQDTGKAMLDDNGKEITSTATFISAAADGSVDVTFAFTGTGTKGKTVVVFESLVYKGAEVAAHSDISDAGQTVCIPEIHTTAVSKAGNHIVEATGEVTVTDTVVYANLIPGKEYTVKGALMDKSTGEAVLDDNGEEIVAETAFTAEEANGSVDVTFVFSGTSMAGKTVVAFEQMYLGRQIVATHADIDDEDQTVYIPKIGTVMTDESGAKAVDPVAFVTLVDEVSYSNLIPGKTYEVNGTLVIKSTGEGLPDANGVPVSVKKEFTPESADGKVSVTFTFDASALCGETVVAFEQVFLDGVSIATHANPEDAEQSIFVNAPAIKTEATVSGQHEFTARKNVALVDTVSYEGLVPGHEYIVSGVLMNKETGKAVLDKSGNEITASTTFVPKESSGSVDVKFRFDAIELEGTTLVVFESLTQGETELASHADINDAAQSVFVSYAPKTGDNGTSSYLLMGTGSAMMAVGIGIYMASNKRKREDNASEQ